MMGFQPAEAASVRALPLPAGLTIVPEADRRLMTIGGDGTVYAIASRIDAPDRTRGVRWHPDGTFELFSPIPQRYDDLAGFAPRIDAVAPASNEAYVTVARTHDGAYLGVRFTTDRWVSGTAKAWAVPACAAIRFESPHVYAVDEERIALTLDPSSDAVGIDLADPRSVESNLPRGLLLDGDRCTSLGTAILTGLRGASVVGYLGYLDGKPAPWFVNLIVQRMVAMRWLDGRESDLGPGVPFATTSSGIAVGASALPGHASESMTTNFFGPAGTYVFATPHAVIWSREGTRSALLHGDARSVAWDVDEAGAVVGTMQRADGRHYAFRWEHGRVVLLDDLPHPEGWRFESAYAIGSNGTIAGIGTYRGIATAFLWRN